MSAKKSLQKLTETEVKINNVLSLKQITNSDLEPLSEAEKDLLMGKITKRFYKSKKV